MSSQPSNSNKEFWLTVLSLNNKNTVYFLTFIIVLFGIRTYINLPKDSYPEIKQPIIYIGTAYPGNSPLDMENLVTRIIEKEVNTISDAEDIKSSSVQDYSTIIVEFKSTADVEQALRKVKDAVDKAKVDLPKDLPADPNVFEVNFSEFPIMNVNISGNYTMFELEKYAEEIKDEIEKVSEISKVEIRGVEEKEVTIKVNPFEMDARNISFQDIENAIRAENLSLSGGTILEGDIRRNITIKGEFKNANDLNNVIIKNENNNIVYLRDIATIEFDFKERESIARLMKNPVVSVDVIKRSGENLLNATAKINDILDKLLPTFPRDVTVTITNDQSDMIREMVSSLENNIISGVILVVLVLLFFLGTRNALFVGMAIPLSMFVSFIILGIFNITINMMILFSLIMGLGMLVDNGIVVVENVYRLLEEGETIFEATKKGVSEVAMPIISSTATTVVAFVPLMMWPGIMGQFMSYLPLGLVITLSSSLFVALVINPVFIASYMKLSSDQQEIVNKWETGAILIAIGIPFLLIGVIWLSNIFIILGLLFIINNYLLEKWSLKFRNLFLPRIEYLYLKTLTFAFKGKNPYYFFGGTIFMFIFSFLLMGIFPPKVIFFPINEPVYINVFIELPIGTDIEETNKVTKNIEDKVFEIIEPYRFMVESVITKIGEDVDDPNAGSVGRENSPHKARITINFSEYKFRIDPVTGQKINTLNILDEVRNQINPMPGIAITVDKDAAGPPSGKPINIEISGPNYDKMVELTENMLNYINNAKIGGIEKLQSDLQSGKPELIIEINRDKARRFGLSTNAIANEIRSSLFGKEVSKLKLGEDDFKIRVQIDDAYRYNINVLMNKGITFREQSTGKLHQVPISSVAKVELNTTLGSVKRKNLSRVLTITSNVLSGYNATEVNNQIKNVLNNFPLPMGYSYKFGGEQEKQAEEMSFLSGALLLAVALIFFIIVAQFNKITTPLIIMTSVLLSTIGVFLGLTIFNMDFVVIMTMLGIISLAGIVVNNAIILIDFIEVSRKKRAEELGVEKLDFENIIQAIIQASKTRLRPVLLTAITTVLGLIPLAVGINIDFVQYFIDYNPNFYMGGDNVVFWGPLSWTIVFGLSFATFLTLVIVPILYLFFAKINRKLKLS